MHCLYQKDERALPGNLQNRKDSFFLSYSPPKSNVSHYFPISFFSLSLSLSLSKEISPVRESVNRGREPVKLKSLHC
jgi:hypothetical protein